MNQLLIEKKNEMGKLDRSNKQNWNDFIDECIGFLQQLKLSQDHLYGREVQNVMDNIDAIQKKINDLNDNF